MTRSILLFSAAAAFALQVSAQDVRLRAFHVTPIASPDQQEIRDTPLRLGSDAAAPDAVVLGEPPTFFVYPVAGTVGGDLAIPYYVDLDPTAVKRDFNCGDLTFNDHQGHDPYIRSFAEQEIGVPVFAVRDGVVIDLRDGEPDQNTTSDPSLKTNYITLRHNDDLITQYVHVRRNSITHALGDHVTAGTQIAMVGSSGPSTAPHIHFEARHGGIAYEPFAGPCRPGRDYFDETHEMIEDPMILGAAFSATSFEHLRPIPWADATPTGTFVAGHRTIFFRTELANVGATTRYELSIARPSGVTATVSSGHLVKYDASLASAWWSIDVHLDRTGEWELLLDVNDGRQLFRMPFTVVAHPSEIANRAPSPLSATLEPVALRAGDVPVCRAAHSGLPDPDYDVVRYRYEWHVNGALVRDVTTAARSDAIGRQYAAPGAALQCTVTASDGKVNAQPVMANATVEYSRRRAARH